jgi:hypothetical protein
MSNPFVIDIDDIQLRPEGGYNVSAHIKANVAARLLQLGKVTVEELNRHDRLGTDAPAFPGVL